MAMRHARSLLWLPTLLAAFAACAAAATAGREGPHAAIRHEEALPTQAAVQQQLQQVFQLHQPLSAINVDAARVELQRDVRLSVSETVLNPGQRGGMWVDVEWEGLRDPKYDDWIALYVPAHANLTAITPAKFKYAFQAPEHMRHGRGHFRFKLISYRQDMVFAIVRGGLLHPTIIALSPVIRVSNPNEPLQVHLALTSSPSEMLVQWVTQSSSHPVVRWGSSPDELKHEAPAKTHTYTRDEMCGGPAKGAGWTDPGLQHVAIMTGLPPMQRMYYQVGDEDCGFSPVFSFMSTPPSRQPSASAPATHTCTPNPSTTPATHAHNPTASSDGMGSSRSDLSGSSSRSRSSSSSDSSTSSSDSSEGEGRQEREVGVLNRHGGRHSEVASSRKLLSRASADGGAGAASVLPSSMSGAKRAREDMARGDVVHVLLTADMGQGEEDGSNAMIMPEHPSLTTTAQMIADVMRGEQMFLGSGIEHGSDSQSPHMAHFAPTLGLHIGDISYAQGFASQWDNFYTQIEPFAARIPWMMADGNHERCWPGSGGRFNSTDSGGECGVPYSKRATMPIQGPDQQWYSFDWGPIHFAIISTEQPTHPGSPQYKWLEADLKGVDRRVTPWLILNGHRPMYVSSTNTMEPGGEQPVARSLQADLEGLMLETQVDLYLSGHHHTYQRTCPVAKGRCQYVRGDGHGSGQPNEEQADGLTAPVHVIIGHGGKGISVNMQFPPPSFLIKGVMWWGYARMAVSADTLQMDVLSNLNGELMDSFNLRKGCAQQAGYDHSSEKTRSE